MPPVTKKVQTQPQRGSAPQRPAGRGAPPQQQPQRGGGGRAPSSNHTARPTTPAANTTGAGWGAVAAKRAQMEEEKELRKKPSYLEVKNKFNLKDGESAVIQFLDEEPFCADGHLLGNDHFNFYPCLKTRQRSCPACDKGVPEAWRVLFRILDDRGTYNKDKGGYTYDENVERFWLMSSAVSETLEAFAKSKGMNLVDMVIQVTRIGSDTKTRYNLELAVDPGTKAMFEPLDWGTPGLPTPEDALTPLTTEAMEYMLNLKPREDNPNRNGANNGRGARTRNTSRGGGNNRGAAGGQGFANNPDPVDDLPF